MSGAPSSKPEEREAHWAALLNELRSSLNPKYGDEFIDDCILLNEDEVKKKYF